MSKLTKIILIAEVPIILLGALFGLGIMTFICCIVLDVIYLAARLGLYLVSLWYDYGDDDD